MPPDYLDHLIMLLSADWVFDHWLLTGLEEKEDGRHSLQRKCRDTVQQILDSILSGDPREYLFVSFSTERISQTTSLFFEAVEQSNLETAFKDQVRKLAEGRIVPDRDDYAAWFLAMLTHDLQGSSHTTSSVGLEPTIISQITSVWNSEQSTLFDLSAIDESSTSPWDCELRSLMPRQPTFLSD